MANIQAGDLNQRIQVLTLRHDEEANAYAWGEAWRAWAKAEPDTRSNLFSTVGIGARGVTFTVRANSRLTLQHAYRWQGRHCFLTAFLPVPASPGYWEVKAALAEPAECQRYVQKQPGARFPGILTEKYLRHEQETPMSVNELQMVLVTPKPVRLRPGELVKAGDAFWEVLIAHELDAYKNEYEIGRTVEL